MSEGLQEIIRLMNQSYDEGVESCAAGPWRTDDPPRDGRIILAYFKDMEYPHLVVPGGINPDIVVDEDEPEYAWLCCSMGYGVSDTDPIRWAEIHMEESDE